MRFFTTLLILLISGCCIASDEVLHIGSMSLSGVITKRPDAAGDWTEMTIPLKRSGNLFLIEATVDTLKGDFILDTGAPYLVLHKTYFRGLSTKQKMSGSGVNGDGSSQADRVTVDTLFLGSAWYNRVEADMIDLGHIEDQKDFRLLGLLGTNLFTSFEVQLDLNARKMVLYRLDESGQPISKNTLTTILDRSPDLSMGFKLCDEKIILPVEVSGQQMNWILDTGAESNVVDAFTKRKVMKDFIILRRINLSGSTGEKQEVLMGIMPQIEVGTTKFDMQQTLVTSMRELSETCSVYIDGILGYSFLQQGIFSLNFQRKEFCFYLYNNNKK